MDNRKAATQATIDRVGAALREAIALTVNELRESGVDESALIRFIENLGGQRQEIVHKALAELHVEEGGK